MSAAIEALWAAIARYIAHRPELVDWLIALAERHPYLHITEADGGLYMGRWWLLRGGPAKEDSPWWLRWLPIAIRIHHIARHDLDRHVHDHPIDFRTILLRGWYMEEDIFGTERMLVSGMTYASRAERFHRITSVPEGGVWTLFILGRRRNVWGFLVDGRKVAWNEYLDSPGSAYANPYAGQGNTTPAVRGPDTDFPDTELLP